jgi:hypothetical protein
MDSFDKHLNRASQVLHDLNDFGDKTGTPVDIAALGAIVELRGALLNLGEVVRHLRSVQGDGEGRVLLVETADDGGD